MRTYVRVFDGHDRKQAKVEITFVGASCTTAFVSKTEQDMKREQVVHVTTTPEARHSYVDPSGVLVKQGERPQGKHEASLRATANPQQGRSEVRPKRAKK